MNKQEIDILEDIKESSDEYQHVILGTYSFDPDFFEWKVLPVFRSKDAETILILTDKKEYLNRFSDMNLAGQEYYIDYCYSAKTFHPKFALMTWSDGIKLVLGSANLTKQAWFGSGELIGGVTLFNSNSDKQAEQILSEFKKFLLLILEKQFLKSEKHRKKIIEVTKLLPTKENNENSNCKLIHNIEEPILHQVKKIIEPESIKSVKILAPFFNLEGSVLEFLSKNGCNEFEIFVQPQKVVSFPKEKIQKLKQSGVKIQINSIKFKENEDRYIHAKAIILKTNSKSFCIYGSANPTFSGMLATPNEGNLELCMFNANEDPNYFDELIQNENFNIEEISLEQVNTNEAKEIKSTKIEKIQLFDAYLEDKNLILTAYTDNDFTDTKIILFHSDKEFLEINSKFDENIQIHLNKDEFEFCSRPTFVQIQCKKDDEIIYSDKRWISTQTLELTPRRIDIEKILRTDGRFGLISFLNKLEKFADDPEWFYYFLQRIKFEKLDSLEPVRRKLVQRKLESEDEKEYEKPPNVNLSENFRKKFEKRHNSIKKEIKEFSLQETNLADLERIFNQFLTWSKVIIWFTLRDQKFLDNLRFIRSNIEEFLILYEKSYQKNDMMDKEFKRLEFWQHFFVFSYLIYTFHKKSGYLKKNPTVVRVFMETFSLLIQEFEKKNDRFSKEELEHSFKEYDEFENLKIDLDGFSRFFEEELSRKVVH